MQPLRKVMLLLVMCAPFEVCSCFAAVVFTFVWLAAASPSSCRSSKILLW